MKSLKCISLAALALIMAGCTKEVQTAEEIVEVSFSAAVPQQVATKAGNSTVNKVVCTVYSDGKEIEGMRETLDIIDGQEIVYTPRLIKNQTYDILFWAMKDDSYLVADMTDISRNTEVEESDYDAFSACISYTVNGTAPNPAVLKRPLAKINLGVSLADLDEAEKVGLTPDRVELTVDAYQAYNVLEKTVNGDSESQTFSIPVPEGSMTIENITYKKLSSSYMFIGSENVTLTYRIYGKKVDNTEVEIASRTISNLPVKQNFNTNLVGNLLTEEVSFKIILEDAFGDQDKNETIE